jgi:glycosyltransferase involved in cell wall biosynthesis
MDRPLRVAFLSEHASPAALLGGVDAGGQNVYVDEVSRNLGRQGIEVDIFTRWESASLPWVQCWAPNIRLITLHVGPAEWLPKDHLWPLMPEFCGAVLDFMLGDRGRYDGLHGDEGGRYDPIHGNGGVRYDLIHGNFWMSGWVALALKRRLHIPVVQIFHALGKTKRREQGEADSSPAGRIAIEETVVRGVDRLIAQCPNERSELIDDYAAEPRKIAVVPSAVNIDRFRPVDRLEARRTLGIGQDERVVVYVGRMLPRKDVRNVLRAAAILIQSTGLPVRVLLVGGETDEPDPVATPEIGELQRLAAHLGIESRVTFAGKRRPDELRLYYGAGDVAVTTPWYEPFGLTPLEAMACGRPVIGSAVGGISYTIQPGVTGYLVPPRDPSALAARLQLLLTKPELGEEMGRAARARVENHFTWPRVAEHTAELYRHILGQEETYVRRQPVLSAAEGARNA